MLSKESKLRVLENFYALDYIFFGKPVKKVSTCCSAITEEYLSIKGALLHVFVEMLRTVEHSPAILKENISSKDIIKNSKISANIARENSKRIVTTEKAKTDIKKMLEETIEMNKDDDINVAVVVEDTIREKAFALAVDNILIAKTLSESKMAEKLNEWEGKIIEDSYKILRNALVESASLILENVE